MTGLAVAVLLVGCTSSGTDDEADETEVRGLTIERDEPQDDDDAEDTEDPVEDAADDAEEPDEAEEAGGPDETEVADTGSEDDVAAPDDTATDDGAADGTGGQPQQQQTRTETRTETRTVDPPTPADLRDGFDRGGVSWAVDEGSWLELSSQVLDPDRPFVESSLVEVDDPDGTAETREARCRTVVRAPQDRGLVAEGALSVLVVVTDADGETASTLRQRVHLDVRLRAGSSVEVEPTTAQSVTRDDVSRVRCEVVFTAA